MTFVRVMLFSVAVLLAYTGFANILPQVQSDPPAGEEAPVAGLDMAGMISFGEKLFSGKGTCTLCHNDLGRAPNLLKLDLASAFAERLKDPRYTGAAKSETGSKAVEVYVRESLVSPSAFVVAGFGKKGSNDAVSPMPKADAAPAELNKVQIDALIAFLQSRAGLEPTVALPDASAPAAESADGDDEDETEPATTAVAAIEKFSCSACHDLEGSEADAGPKLNGISKRMDASKIAEAIIKPNAEIAKGFEADTMPLDFAEQMRVSELNLIVKYLIKLPESGSAQ